MTINILFAAHAGRWPDYREPLTTSLTQAGLDFDLRLEFADPAQVDYIIVAPNGPISDFGPFTRVRAVLSIWAGVEGLVDNPTLHQPLVRMVDTGLTEGMVEWVTGHVLRHHLGMDAHICATEPRWDPNVPPLARDRPVGILGLGALGQAVAQSLSHLNFPVTGWSRGEKTIEGIVTRHGDAGLADTLRRSQILVLLLPLTPQTTNILNAERLGLLPRGAIVVNPARGQMIDDDALLAALDRGDLGHATLDVFRHEPLAADHPFWTHPKVTVTPHIASETRPRSASEAIAQNIRRSEQGKPLLHVVDRTAGY